MFWNGPNYFRLVEEDAQTQINYTHKKKLKIGFWKIFYLQFFGFEKCLILWIYAIFCDVSKWWRRNKFNFNFIWITAHIARWTTQTTLTHTLLKTHTNSTPSAYTQNLSKSRKVLFLVPLGEVLGAASEKHQNKWIFEEAKTLKIELPPARELNSLFSHRTWKSEQKDI